MPLMITQYKSSSANKINSSDVYKPLDFRMYYKKYKMDFKVKVHGITLSHLNLSDYSHSKGPNISGTTRLIHVESSKDGEETNYFTYARKMVSKTTFSLQCHQFLNRKPNYYGTKRS